MKIINYILLIGIIGLSSCKSNIDKSTDEIIGLEKQLQNVTISQKDSIGNLLLNKYLAFVKQNPKNEMLPSYKYKAGEMADALNLPSLAVSILEGLYQEHPNTKEAPKALFLSAFIYENKILDLDKAKMQYELFLDTYPNHSFAKDARASLENLGLSPEELIRKFEAQNQQPS